MPVKLLYCDSFYDKEKPCNCTAFFYNLTYQLVYKNQGQERGEVNKYAYLSKGDFAKLTYNTILHILLQIISNPFLITPNRG